MEDYDEIKEMETETLKEIFPNEFTVIRKNQWKVSIKCAEEQEYRLGVTLIFTLPSDYPNSVPKIELYPFGLKIIQSSVDFLLEDLNQEASSRVGQAMVYDLVDFLRNKMVNLENEISMGEISFLPEEIILHIFSFLNIQSLGILLQVSIAINKLVSRPIVWKERCNSLYSPKDREKHANDKCKNWKTKCLSLYFSRSESYYEGTDFDYKYIISIMDRIGTGDSWIGPNWKENFVNEFQESAKVILQSLSDPYEGRILNSTDKSFIGTFKLLSPSYIQSIFRSKQWWAKKTAMNIYNCRYLGEEKGWCAFTLYSSVHNQRIISNLINICRGVFKEVATPHNCTASVIYHKVWINYSLGFKNNKPAILHASLNSNVTPHTIQPLSPFGSPTSYSRNTNATLIKLSNTKYNKNNNIISESSCLVWMWVLSTHLVENIDQNQKYDYDNAWEALKYLVEPTAPYFLEQMHKKKN